MSNVPALALSPAFERARILSRFMAVLFSVGFGLTLFAFVVCLSIPFASLYPHGHVGVGFHHIKVSLDGLSAGRLVWVLVAVEMTILPLVFLMHHTRKVFGHFAKGEIFVLPVVRHIRHAGLWLIVAFFADVAGQIMLRATGLMPPGLAEGPAWPLVIGVVTFIAAYVMGEARRIADENASIL